MVENVLSISKDEQVRTDIKLAAKELFQRFGLLKTTMEDIAKASCKGKSTLYYYYKSKDDIFDAVIKDDMENVFTHVKKAVGKARTAQEKLKAFAMTKFSLLEEKAALFGIVFGEILDNPRLIKKLKKQYEKLETELLISILSAGVQSGEFKRMPSEDLDNLAYVIVCSIRGLQLSLIEDNCLRKASTRFGLISDIMVEGIKK